MSIIRAARPQSNFYILDKRISEDSRLSWAARGLLVFLLGKPDNWKVSVEHLRKEGPEKRGNGREAIYGYIDELIAAGYVSRKKHASGEMDYYVSEIASDPNTANPDLGNPDQANPNQAQTTLVSTDTKQVKKKASTDIETVSSDEVVQEGVDAKAAKEWLAIRKRKRLDLTPLAWEAFKNEASKAGISLQTAVMKCIARGWGSFEAEWVLSKSQRGGNMQSRSENNINGFLSSFGGPPDDPMVIDMEPA